MIHFILIIGGAGSFFDLEQVKKNNLKVFEFHLELYL